MKYTRQTEPRLPLWTILWRVHRLVSFNQYIGWYDGCPTKQRASRGPSYPSRWSFSEFGADALQGWHADALTRFSEEYQEDLYRKTIAMLARSRLAGRDAVDPRTTSAPARFCQRTRR